VTPVIVTLLTDFGTADYFVGAMKGVILDRHRDIRIVDITHEVPPQDIATAAFLLLAVYRDFPPGTIHLVVVDPGVGSSRDAIVARVGPYTFVAPDNGVLSYVLDGATGAEVRRLENGELRREVVSTTFHGRDVFAPAAAALAAGFPFERTGPLHDRSVRLPPLRNQRAGDGSVTGSVLHIDRFGNCVTSLTGHDLQGEPGGYVYRIGDHSVEGVRETYAGAAPGVPFMVMGSAGFLEISMNGRSASAWMGVTRGQVIRAIPRASA